MSAYDALSGRLGLTSRQLCNRSQSQVRAGSWLYACDTGELWISDTARRYYGLRPGAAPDPERLLGSVPPGDDALLRAALLRLSQGKPYHVVHRICTGGKTRWLEQRARLHRGRGGHTDYVVGTVQDISQLKREQLRLEERRADFAAITAYLAETTDSTDLRAVADSVRRTICQRLNPACMAVFVRRGQEITRIIPQDMDPMHAFLFQDIESFTGYRAVVENRRQLCPAREYPSPLGREALSACGGKSVVSLPVRHGGKAIGALSVVTRSEEGLTRSEYEFCRTICGYLANQLYSALLCEQLKQELELRVRLESDREVIFNESVDYISILDREGRFAQINPAFAGRLGYPPQDLAGRSVYDFIHPDDHALVRYTLSALPGLGVVRGFCNRFVSRSGEVGYLENNLKYSPATHTVIAIARDLTRQQEAEARNLDLERAVALEKLKSEFFSNLSHEFKTPLNVILSSLSLIQATGEREGGSQFLETYGRFFDYANQNCYRLQRLTANLLDSSRIDSQYFRLSIAPYDLGVVISDIVRSASGYAEQSCVTLRCFRSASPLWGLCDVNSLDRILLNLLSNAIRHTCPGGEIGVTLSQAGGDCLVAVRDTGSGIPAELLPHLFEKFFTAPDPCSACQDGSGVGLFLVRSLVELQGGQIRVESLPGRGSTFTFSLPACPVPAHPMPPPDEAARLDYHRARARQELSNLEACAAPL